MIAMTVSEIAELLGLPDPRSTASVTTVTTVTTVTSVEFDSRKVTPGTLFVAFAGEQVDGHDFAEAAARAGAVAVLGSRAVAAALPLLRVDDVLEALSALARHSVTRLQAGGLDVIGVTGSSGKTSTKDLIAAVLRHHVGEHAVVAPPESFNNELGLPYTALKATGATRFLVLELSARGPGHIAWLTTIAPPRIGAVLNVGSAHLGEFGSVEGIAAAKGELVEALPPAADGGIAVLNADDGRVLAMRSRTRARVVTVGTSSEADLRATDIGSDELARARFTLRTPDESVPVQLAVSGSHQIGNALTAAAIALEVGMNLVDIAAALAAAVPASKWRMAITERPDGVTVINDAYNANPDSMRAALRTLATIGSGRRTWAVLGEMGELGEGARDAHDEIGRLAVRLGVDRLIVVGERARALHLGAHLEGSWNGESELVPDIPAALAVLDEQLEAGDVVLVKASRSVGLERVAQALVGASA